FDPFLFVCFVFCFRLFFHDVCLCYLPPRDKADHQRRKSVIEIEREEERRREEELQKERERLFLERKQKEEENRFLLQRKLEQENEKKRKEKEEKEKRQQRTTAMKSLFEKMGGKQ
ncbi:PREDICTED: inner centromere protein-like, partial [Acropora digitifera]|uniref:inner centromere protein-like n=1 Tax=Acropora digitifera TaxID=70779 RepID=UPI00077A8DA6